MPKSGRLGSLCGLHGSSLRFIYLIIFILATPAHAQDTYHPAEPQTTFNLSDCFCFKLCTPSDATAFRARIPDQVWHHDSPWLKYLHAVYGGVVALPFDLRRVNFFYQRDLRWWTHFAHVPWPMATCLPRAAGGASGVRESGQCHADVCRPWLRSAQQLQSAAPAMSRVSGVTQVYFIGVANGNGFDASGNTRGVLLEENNVSKAHKGAARAAHLAHETHVKTHVEVMHGYRATEGWDYCTRARTRTCLVVSHAHNDPRVRVRVPCVPQMVAGSTRSWAAAFGCP